MIGGLLVEWMKMVTRALKEWFHPENESKNVNVSVASRLIKQILIEQNTATLYTTNDSVAVAYIFCIIPSCPHVFYYFILYYYRGLNPNSLR